MAGPMYGRQLSGGRTEAEEFQTRRNTVVGAVEEAELPSAAREYVHSMHQNTKATLLYGKNNVAVSCPESRLPLKGYLSLLQNGNGTLSIQWTPNELMHSESLNSPTALVQRNDLWKKALRIPVEDVVYLHYHQKAGSGGSVVLVGADGVQHPPILFPAGQHPLAFLSCLENGLLPWGQLDPPLWLQRGKGKVLPKLRKKSNAAATAVPASRLNGKLPSTEEADEGDEDPTLTHDYVFRVVPLTRAGFGEVMLNGSNSSSTTQLSGSSSAQPTPGLVSSRLLALSSLSNKLKDRFLSISSSPTSSPPPTPKSQTSLGEEDESGGGSSGGGHDVVQKRNSEPVFTLTEAAERAELPLPDRLDEPDAKELSLKSACNSMRYQILSRAFYGWLAHCRHHRTIREHLAYLVKSEIVEEEGAEGGVTREAWAQLRASASEGGQPSKEAEFELHRLAYFGGVEEGLRAEVWPYLTGWVEWEEELDAAVERTRQFFESQMTAWMAVEAIVKQRDAEAFAAARALHSAVAKAQADKGPEREAEEEAAAETSAAASAQLERQREVEVDKSSGESTPEEGEGGVYSAELIDTMALNLHRIEKDVQRCDRAHPYFGPTENLDKLKRMITTFVWENLETGYIQGMCDIAAPLLVVFDDEVKAFGAFRKLMERMSLNFPQAGGMDAHLANMRSLIQVMDPELFDLMRANGDYTHFYFCYRWFLLDFKRELGHGGVLGAWEVLWGARKVASGHFILFLALAFLLLYRSIILDNNMDFTDIIKFYNEMAENHDAGKALKMARQQLRKLQLVIRDDPRSQTSSL